ncbi:MAG: hypothetical protein H7A09_10115 [Oceanospirillaceae bacterium]|nr:hypothetical protein [Oceanospirillaceae bacterium]
MGHTGQQYMEMTVSTRGWFGTRKPMKAQLVKFNRFSLMFSTSKKLKQGQYVEVNLSCGCLSLREVIARVESCERAGKGYIATTRFVLERPDKVPYREAMTLLKSIEQSLPSGMRAPLHMG